MDKYIKSLVIDNYPDLAPDEARRGELDSMLEDMWRECQKRRALGYSDHQLALAWKMPDIFRLIKPLITSMEDLQRFCRAMPVIVKWLPYDSAESPVGYIHTIFTSSFANRVQASRTLDEFLQGFGDNPVSVCPQCGQDATVKQLAHSHSISCPCGFLKIC